MDAKPQIKHVVRMEIVVDEAHASHLIDVLARTGLREYTAIHRATGRGSSGLREGDHFGAFSNAYVLIACSEEEAATALPTIAKVLASLGGICLTSEAKMLKYWS